MFLSWCGLAFTGFCAGIGVSAGTFAFMLVIHVIPRIIQKAKIEKWVIAVENTIMAGIVTGTVLSLFNREPFHGDNPEFMTTIAYALLAVFGASAGMFVGCTSVALAEILDTFPIFFRRIHLKEKAAVILLFAMALGKTCGALFFFCFGYGLP